jgi:hypothetical protein
MHSARNTQRAGSKPAVLMSIDTVNIKLSQQAVSKLGAINTTTVRVRNPQSHTTSATNT